jgi:GTPase SAR1 family protein
LFQNYAPTTFNRYISETTVANRRVRFTIWDTAGGREPANSTRALACREADVLLLCYRISDPASLFNAINFWVPELRLHAPTTPLLLVGCQSDMRTDPATLQALAKVGRSPVSAGQALAMSQQMQAVMYVETSSKVSARGVATAMELAALTALGQVTPPPPTASQPPPLHQHHLASSQPATPAGTSPALHPLAMNSRNSQNHHHRQSSLLLLPSSPSSSSSSSQSSPSPMISSKKHRNRSLSMTRHHHQNRGAGTGGGPAPLSRTALDLLSSVPISEDDNASGIYAIEPSEAFWKQFPSLLGAYGSSDIISSPENGSQPESSSSTGGSPLAVRLAGEPVAVAVLRGGDVTPAENSPRSPLLTGRSKMGSLSSMSMRSKSSTLSSTKSDSSMLSITNSRSSSSSVPAVAANSTDTPTTNNHNSSTSYTSTNLNNSHTISITTRTPKAGRKTPKKNNGGGGGGEAEKMIKIKCQRLREEDRTYEEVEIEVPAPVYETMQAYTENGGGAAASARKLTAEKRTGGIGTKIKCLFSKTAS